MSCLCYCDEDDCQNTENDMKLYDLNYTATKSLGKFLRNNGHICQWCLDLAIEDYPNLVIEDDVFGPVLNPDFKEDE